MLSAKPELLKHLSHWALGNGLEIVLLVTGAILLTRLATWLGGKITDRIDANARETDALVRSEASKHRHALAQVDHLGRPGDHLLRHGIAVAAGLGIPVTSLVAPAAVVGGRARLRRTAHRAGHPGRVLHHHRAPVRVRRPGAPGRAECVDAGDGDGRGRHAAGHHGADRRRRGGHHPQWPDQPGNQPVPRLGPRRLDVPVPAAMDVNQVSERSGRSASRPTRSRS